MSPLSFRDTIAAGMRLYGPRGASGWGIVEPPSPPPVFRERARYVLQEENRGCSHVARGGVERGNAAVGSWRIVRLREFALASLRRPRLAMHAHVTIKWKVTAPMGDREGVVDMAGW